MADGDEKIDEDDQVLVLNRVSDAPTESMWNGIPRIWAPGQIRSTQRVRAAHYIEKSLVLRDPTHENPPIFKLVIVDDLRQAVEEGQTTTPMTLAECKDLSKYGSIDTRNLPPERMIGGQMLMDPDGNVPTRREIRGAPKDGPSTPPNL